MMVSFKYLNVPIEFSEGKVPILVIENKRLFREVIKSFEQDEADGLFVFSENYNPVNFSKTGYFISNAFNVDLNNKKLLAKVSSFLEESANADFVTELEQIVNVLTSFGEKLCSLTDFDCEFNYDISTADIIKFLQIKLGSEETDVAEKLVSFMVLMNKYLKIQVFAVPYLHLLFDDEELLLIYETLSLNHIKLLSIECTCPNNKNETETLYIIDKDLCSIDNSIE